MVDIETLFALNFFFTRFPFYTKTSFIPFNKIIGEDFLTGFFFSRFYDCSISLSRILCNSPSLWGMWFIGRPFSSVGKCRTTSATRNKKRKTSVTLLGSLKRLSLDTVSRKDTWLRWSQKPFKFISRYYLFFFCKLPQFVGLILPPAMSKE